MLDNTLLIMSYTENAVLILSIKITEEKVHNLFVWQAKVHLFTLMISLSLMKL